MSVGLRRQAALGRRSTGSAFVLALGVAMGSFSAAPARAGVPMPPLTPPPSQQPPPAGAAGTAPTAPAAALPAPAPPPGTPPAPPPLTVAPVPDLPTVVAAAVPTAPPPPPRVVPTADSGHAESDHDLVLGAWGVEARPVATTLPVFARRPGTGCPTTPGTTSLDCPDVAVSALSVRHWLGRNLAWTGGLAFSLGGGRDTGRLLDTYFGFGPLVGVSVLLGNWRHVAVAASPELSIVMFKGAGSVSTAYVSDLRAVIEAEVHFGFISLPSLSLGVRSGLLFRMQHAADVTVWSVDVSGATSVRALVSDLTLRYYF